MGIITVVGGSDSAIAVTVDGSEATRLAEQFRDDLLTHYYKDRDLDISTFTSGEDVHLTKPSSNVAEGAIINGGQYNVDDSVDYLVVGGFNKNNTANPILLTNPVTINSAMSSGHYVRILAGNVANSVGQVAVEYHAGKEAGTFIGGSNNNPVHFIGNETDGSNWKVSTGNGDDTIISGSGNNTINAGGGNNTISLGGGNNSVNSNGQDTITAPDNGGYNTITLKGGSSTVHVGTNSVVNDVSSANHITVGGGSTVVGGDSGNIEFDSANNGNMNMLVGGDSNTITATADNLQVVHGSNDTFDVAGNLKFFNGVGETNTTITGSSNGNSQIYGASGLDFHLTAQNNSSSVLLVAGTGNETLDASHSSSDVLVYANTQADVSSTTKLLATGGSGNDTLVAGVGSSTLTGGDGDNVFMFTKESDTNGNTVITDFSKSKGNKIEFLNYGFDQNDINNILKNAQTDSQGNAVLDLTNHKLTLQGVSVSDLDISQFIPSGSKNNTIS